MLKEDIKDIRVTVLNGKGNLKAFVSFQFANGLVVQSWKIMERADGEKWLAPPSFPPKQGETKWRDVAFFLDKEDRVLATTLALDKYYVELEKTQEFGSGSDATPDESTYY